MDPARVFLFFCLFYCFIRGRGRFLLLFCSFFNFLVDLLHARLDLQLADAGALLEGSIDLNVTADQVMGPVYEPSFR